MHNSRIICAANKLRLENGSIIVIAGARHWDKGMHEVADALFHGLERELEQGFIDQFNNFYTRKEAWIIAETNGQIIRRVGGDMSLEGEGKLFSENLY
jgi:sulfate adenylyltransferase subunit 1 (EFTu-like GTPase family)